MDENPQGAWTPRANGEAVRFEGLTRRFGDRVAVNGLTLTVNEGEFFGFLGPNGAGKSTTIKMARDCCGPRAARFAF